MTNSKITSFTDLHAWQKAHALSLWIYKTTNKYPSDERFGLTNQLRRASVSVTSNIAEGFGRRSFADKAYRYELALGSLYEIQSQLLISKDIGYITIQSLAEIAPLALDVSKLINKLIVVTKSAIRDS